MAVLLASLAPTLSHGLASATGTGWIEVCTNQGARWIQAGDDGSQRAPASAHVLEHCPYCSLHAPDLGLPPVAGRVHLPLQQHPALPLALLVAPYILQAWATVQPRAPPLVS